MFSSSSVRALCLLSSLAVPAGCTTPRHVQPVPCGRVCTGHELLLWLGSAFLQGIVALLLRTTRQAPLSALLGSPGSHLAMHTSPSLLSCCWRPSGSIPQLLPHQIRQNQGLRHLCLQTLNPKPQVLKSRHAGLAASAPSACNATTDLLQKISSARDPLALEGFRLVAAFLRSCPSYQPTQQQVTASGASTGWPPQA